MTPRILFAFARMGFLDLLAYRLRYYTGILNYFISVTVYYFIWKAVFTANPEFGGFSFPEMITYVVVGWIIRSMYFNNVDWDLAMSIQEGKISMEMLRPVNLPLAYAGRAIGEAAFRTVLLCLPSAAVFLLVFPVRPPVDFAHFALFVVSLGGSVLLVAGINFIAGSCAIELTSIQGLLRFKYWLQELLSGLLVPLALFPAPLRELSSMLPFEHIGYTPMMIYLGKIPAGQIRKALALEVSWIIVLFLFGNWFWNRISRRITIHGG